MIIALTGLKGSGKDTVGAYLMKEHNFERRAFADPGKKYLSSVLDIPPWDIEKFKNDETVFVTTGNKNEPDFSDVDGNDWMPGVDFPESFVPSNIWSPIVEHTFRQFTQRFIENAKLVFGEDVWANLTLPVGGFYTGRAIVVTDLRFKNEADRVKNLGGYIVRIIKPDSDLDKDLHRSEVEQFNIKEDYRILNDSSVQELYHQVETTLEAITTDASKWPGER